MNHVLVAAEVKDGAVTAAVCACAMVFRPGLSVDGKKYSAEEAASWHIDYSRAAS